jgi:hypothetical protein
MILRNVRLSPIYMALQPSLPPSAGFLLGFFFDSDNHATCYSETSDSLRSTRGCKPACRLLLAYSSTLKMRRQVTPKRRPLSDLYVVASQRTLLLIGIAVRTSNPAQYENSHAGKTAGSKPESVNIRWTRPVVSTLTATIA